MDWHCIVNGSQQGPLDPSELQAMVREGRLKPDDYVWTPAFGEEWHRMRDVPEFAPPPPAASDPIRAEPVFETPLTDVPGRKPLFKAAMQQAWDRMVAILFRPFDLARWFAIGFCAWIATLSSGGINLPTKGIDMKSLHANPTPEACRDLLIQSYHNLLAELARVGISLVALLVICGAFMIFWAVVVCWLRARGAFMLIHRWHRPDAPVKECWAAGRHLGQSLFAFRLAFGLLMFVCTILICVGAAFSVVMPLLHGVGFTQTMQLWALGWLTALLTVLAIGTTVKLLLDHFVAPIMYWRRVMVFTAWRPVLALCNEQPAAIVIFLTLYPLLAFAAGLAALLLGCGTCGIGCCLMLLPYIGAVVLLPRDLFFRGIGIYFLRQWRPDLTSTCAED